MIHHLPERKHWQLVVRLPVNLDDQAPGGRHIGSPFEPEQELQDFGACRRGKSVGIRCSVVTGAEQHASIQNGLLTPQCAISQVEPAARAELGLEL